MSIRGDIGFDKITAMSDEIKSNYNMNKIKLKLKLKTIQKYLHGLFYRSMPK